TGKLFHYHPKLNPVGTYLLGDGSLLVCEKAYTVVQIFEDGSVAALMDAAQHQKVDFCNDLSIDGDGNIYFSNSHSGEVWRLSVAGALDRVLAGMNFPNGVEVDPKSEYLYVSGGGKLWSVALPKSGNSF